MIKTLLAPYETYLWAALAIGLLIGSVILLHHIEDIGANKVIAQDAQIVALQDKLKAKVEADAQLTLDSANSQLETALAAPPPAANFTLRVCGTDFTPSPNALVPPDGSAGPQRGSTPVPVRNPVAGVPQGAGVDIRPATEQLLAHADAEIAYWRKYYADCKAHGICK